MGIALMEEFASTVGAILKTLECPICLELLKTPISVGCGHFFCRKCISGILQSTYRTPCPLCKRLFTRRSVQEASQRESVIAAAKVLAICCTRETGINFLPQDSITEYCGELEINVGVPPKKLKTSNEIEDVSARKRKSCENEDDIGTLNVEDLEVKNCMKEDDNASLNKRVCPYSEDDDDSLPALADVVNQCQKSSVLTTSDTVTEECLSFKPTSSLKSYSNYKKSQKKNFSDAFDLMVVDSKLKDLSTGGCQESTSHDGSDPTFERPKPLKNEVNALKNKTNEIQSNPNMKEEHLDLKTINLLQEAKKNNIELENKSKENELCESPISKPNNISSLKSKQVILKNQGKLKRKSITRQQNNKKNIASNKNSKEIEQNHKEDSYTLNEINISPSQHANPSVKKSVEDPFKSIGLTDTAVSVGFVASPLTTKMPSMHKSPGWSRVKEVKKDFRMKKFASLHVEKNSPNISFKIPAVQEMVSNNSKVDLSANACVEDKIINCKSTAFDVIANEKILQNNKETKDDSEVVAIPTESNNVDKLSSSAGMDCPDGRSKNCNMKESTIFINNVPSVNITSNSVICAQYSDAVSKVSSQNIMKSQKFSCKLQNTMRCSNFSDVPEYEIPNCPTENRNEFFSTTSDLSRHVSEYENFHSHSLHNDNNFEYVEQSQQTSQMFGFHNAVCNNLNTVVQQQHWPNIEKTKVVKRTCLTLEEIQDYFVKSNQSQSPETICCLPFLSGLFKLHIGISDETLNVSVLKVIDSTSACNTGQLSVLPLSDKCIQAPNSLPVISEVEPSSNAGSEASDMVDPFPFLNKQTYISLAAKGNKENITTVFDERDPLTKSANNKSCPEVILSNENQGNCVIVKDVDVSENFPSTEAHESFTSKEYLPCTVKPSQNGNTEENIRNDSTALPPNGSHSMANPLSMECDFPKTISNKDFSDEADAAHDLDDSSKLDNEESLKKLQECVEKGRSMQEKKPSRLSLKQKSFEMHEESNVEFPLMNKRLVKNIESQATVSKTQKLVSPIENSKKGLPSSVNLGEVPSMLNSMLSEEASEMNTTEIQLEIEDLSDKIKSLEEKLKLCGSSTLNKSNSLPQSDSEDSVDLFPQSVPPTPPKHI